MATILGQLPPRENVEADFHIQFEMCGGTLTSEDRQLILQETGCRASTRDRRDGKGRLFTLKGPQMMQRQAYELAKQLIEKTAWTGAGAFAHL